MFIGRSECLWVGGVYAWVGGQWRAVSSWRRGSERAIRCSVEFRVSSRVVVSSSPGNRHVQIRSSSCEVALSIPLCLLAFPSPVF